MKRGYSITLNNEGKAVKSIDDVNVNDTLITLVKDGKIVTEVKKINKGE
jgi:exonuclease VII large subunit